jgi:hypothetical protein
MGDEDNDKVDDEDDEAWRTPGTASLQLAI